MILHFQLLSDTVQFAAGQHVLIINSAADPFVLKAAQQLHTGQVILAEDNISALPPGSQPIASPANPTTNEGGQHLVVPYRHVPFHKYILHEPPATIDVAVMNMLYQPSNAWMIYGLQVAGYALKPGGHLYVVGAKDRGVLSMAKRMQTYFGNVETLAISKGQRVLCSRKNKEMDRNIEAPFIEPFAEGKLDEGTRLLLEALEVRTTDEALDIGCGAGFIGIHIARLATNGHVTMVDASLAAVDAARRRVRRSDLANVQVLPSDGAQAVLSQRFNLVVTNPPFHQGGIQTTETAERFIREAAQVLRPRGRFYLVANRFLKYEPMLRTCFKMIEEVGGNTRYKVLRALN
jgi:16S rRNA (guanine1207-N2)-methyltransferase